MSKAFRLQKRVYVDHTDAGGVVYHAQYLVYFEHARTDALRVLGVIQPAAHNNGTILVVASVNMQYLAPAKLDDALIITAKPIQLARTYTVFAQEVYKDKVLLCRAEIKIACVHKATFKIKPLPQTTTQALSLWMTQTDMPCFDTYGSHE